MPATPLQCFVIRQGNEGNSALISLKLRTSGFEQSCRFFYLNLIRDRKVGVL